MDYYRYDQITGDGVKEKYIKASLQWLSLKPQLLDNVKTDKELILRVEQFARELCEFDKENFLT